MSEPLTHAEIADLRIKANAIKEFAKPSPENELLLRLLATIAALRAELLARDDEIAKLVLLLEKDESEHEYLGTENEIRERLKNARQYSRMFEVEVLEKILSLRAELNKRESMDMEEAQRRIAKRVFGRLKEAEAERDELKAQLAGRGANLVPGAVPAAGPSQTCK